MKDLKKKFKMPEELRNELLIKYRKDVAKEVKDNEWQKQEFGWMLGWTPQITSNFFNGKSEIGSCTMLSIAHVLDDERFVSLCSRDCLKKMLEEKGY